MSTVPLARALSNIEQEIASLRDTTLDLEAAIATTLVKRAGPLETQALRTLQGIDLMAQTLAALCDFMRDLGAELSPDQIVDLSAALRKVPLEDVANRLRSLSDDLDPQAPHPPEVF